MKSALDNGIWLCPNDATLVDKNLGSGYSAEQLWQWRNDHEAWARARLEGLDEPTPNSPILVEFDADDRTCVQDRRDHPQRDLQVRIRVANSGSKTLKEVTCQLMRRHPYATPGVLRVMNDNHIPYVRSNTGIKLSPNGGTGYFDIAFHKHGTDQVVFEYADDYLRNKEQALNPMGAGVYFLTLEVAGVRTDN